MASPNTNALTVAFLQQILEARGWTQNDLADKSGLHRATVIMHLSKQRPIRDEHLVHYAEPLDRKERQLLVASWLRDSFGRDVIADIVDPATSRVREEVLEWAPKLESSDRKMLDWLAKEMADDYDLLGMLRSVCRRLGYKPEQQLTG